MLLLFLTTQNKEKAPVNSLFCAFLLLFLATEYVKKAHKVGRKQIAYVYILYSVRKPIQVELFRSIKVYRGTGIKNHKYVYLLCTNRKCTAKIVMFLVSKWANIRTIVNES
jgi:hypothetical protein